LNAKNRVNNYGRQYHLLELSGGRTQIRTGIKTIVINHDIEKVSQAWYDWTMRGELIQVAFPFLDNSEREFLITAMTPEEWDSLFSELDEDE
jgi:hypothetical protein